MLQKLLGDGAGEYQQLLLNIQVANDVAMHVLLVADIMAKHWKGK